MSLTWRATFAVGSVTIQVRLADVFRRKTGDDAAKGRRRVDEKALEAIRRVIREEVRPIIQEEVRPIIREEVRPIIQEEVRPIIQEEVRPMFREELQPINKRLDRLECKTDAIHRDLMTLRVELRGVIDPDFPFLLATEG